MAECRTQRQEVCGSSLISVTVLSDASPSVPLLGIKGRGACCAAYGTLHTTMLAH